MNYRLAPHTAWRAILDETIVLDLDSARLYGLNQSAAFIWQTIETGGSFDSLLQAMAGESPAFGADEIESFCEELVELGLLEAGAPAETKSEGQEPTALELHPTLEPPRVLWQETLQQVAASCAFLPGQSVLCNQVPTS